ncbi:hypothetical protein R6Q59_009199, partial [Mikania micrantha]
GQAQVSEESQSFQEPFRFTSRKGGKSPCRPRKLPRRREGESSRQFLNYSVGSPNESRPKKLPRPNFEIGDGLDLNYSPFNSLAAPDSVAQQLENTEVEGPTGSDGIDQLMNGPVLMGINVEIENTIKIAESVGIHIANCEREVGEIILEEASC